MIRLRLLVTFVMILMNNAHALSYRNATKIHPQSSNEVHECPSDEVFNTDGERYFWKYSKSAGFDYFTSKTNVCWDAGSKNIAIRKCDLGTGNWIPSKVNCASWKRRNRFCPEDLIEIPLTSEIDKYVCIKLTDKPSEFNENVCYGSDTFFTLSKSEKFSQTLISYLKERNINSLWMPVTQLDDNEFSPFVWRLPGEHWGEVLKVNKVESYKMLPNSNCLVVNFANGSIETKVTHCDNKFYSMCVYEKYFVAKSGCPQNFKALSYRPNYCYGVFWQKELSHNELKPMTMPEYFRQRNILRMVFDANDYKNSMFFLLEEFKVNDISINVEMNAKEEFRIMPLNRKISVLSTNIANSKKKVEMTLKVDAELEGLVLTVYNRNYIWQVDDGSDNFGIKCFTNAGYDVWTDVDIKDLIWENDRQTKSMFKLKLYGEGPGYYWCEAHTIFNFSVAETAKVVAAKPYKGHPFAMFFDIPCNIKNCTSPYNELKKTAQQIKKILKDNIELKENHGNDIFIHNVRIMNIESIDKSLISMRVLCHVTVSVDTSAENTSEEDDSEKNDLEKCHDMLTKLVAIKQPHLTNTINSTEFCFPEEFHMASGEHTHWVLAKLGQTSTTQKLCLQANGLPVTRKCLGDFLHGAYWEVLPSKEIDCITDTVESIITQNLYALDSSKLYKKAPKEAVNNIKELLEESIDHLIPADFYYIGKIIQGISNSLLPDTKLGANAVSPATDVDDDTTELTLGLVKIFNYLMKVNEDIIQPSIRLNSTNVLLEAFENFIDKTSLLLHYESLNNKTMSKTSGTSIVSGKDDSSKKITESDKYVETIDYEDVGVVVKITSKFVIFVIDPTIANITGIAIFSAGEYSAEDFSDFGLLRGAFKDEFYRFVLANQSVEELLYEPGVQLATYVPETLWYRLDEIALLSNRTSTSKSATRIVIKVYSNDILFQEERQFIHQKVLGKIISVSIPGRDRDLPEMLPLVLRTDSAENDNETEAGCGYWNYKTWVSDGLVFLGSSEVDKNLILCGCTHLTPFAYLIGASFNFSVDSEESEVVIITKIHKAALDLITLLGCSLSLFGIVGIFITAITFHSWRNKASSKVLLQLSAAIALQMVLFCFVNTEEISHHLIANEIFLSCIALGACMHYSVLVQFCWMAVIAYLQFKRYVQVFGNTRPKHFFIKSSLIGWGLPLLPVLCVLLTDRESYIPSYNAENTSICYPSGYSLYFGVVLPIIFVIVANLGIFFIIIYNVLRRPEGSIRHTEKKMVLSQIRLTFLLFFLLGFTWIFGLLTIMKAGIMFSYLFCLTATLQGFVLFIYFIVLDPVTRRMWCGRFRRIFKLNNDFESSTSMKETTQTH